MRFNSRTREGCDRILLLLIFLTLIVSIHAPGRGATRQSCHHGRPRRFNSRTREGCDKTFTDRFDINRWFQFTHPGGVRLGVAPSARRRTGSFNSRTREGCDLDASLSCPTIGCFNSRTREGCDTRLVGRTTLAPSFNSRTREGCDIDKYLISISNRVSIHAPGRGATRAETFTCNLTSVSIHAPGRGATSFYPRLRSSLLRFNSRTREGCDWLPVRRLPRLLVFQFTHPGGVRRASVYSCFKECHVSIHAPGRGATPTPLPSRKMPLVSIHAPGRGATVWCKVAYYGADKQA